MNYNYKMGQEISPELLRWVSSGYGYVLMFLAMLVEGPAVTALGAFGAILGYFDLRVVFLLSVLGNLVPDLVYYLVGFWGRNKIIDKYGKYLMLSHERLLRLEKLYHEHVGKAIFIVKLFPLLATPGLIVAGITKVPIRKFALWSLAVTLPSSLFFLLLGYYFGSVYKKIVEYVGYGSYLLIGTIAIFLIVSYLYRRFAKKVSESVEKI